MKWRDGEYSYKQFTQLTRSEKDKYLELLTGIDEEHLSYNDYYILQNYSKPVEPVLTNKFLEL